jgi:hypothetical protein
MKIINNFFKKTRLKLTIIIKIQKNIIKLKLENSKKFFITNL